MCDYLDRIVAELEAAREIDLSGYRRGTLQRRINARIARVCDGDSEVYLQRLRTDSNELNQLISAITIKVSSFFRNPLVFELVGQNILPDIIERKNRSRNREVRIWSAGCAAGEEAYSLSILAHQAMKGKLTDWTTLIFATDIDASAIETAKAGVYARSRLESVKLGVLDKYFDAAGDRFCVRPFVRRMVRFSQDDLTSSKLAAPAESIFGSFDLVFCRNVLIYFSREVQAEVFRKLCRSLVRGGYLVLGDSESLSKEMESKFQTIDSNNRIFRKLPL